MKKIDARLEDDDWETPFVLFNLLREADSIVVSIVFIIALTIIFEKDKKVEGKKDLRSCHLPRHNCKTRISIKHKEQTSTQISEIAHHT